MQSPGQSTNVTWSSPDAVVRASTDRDTTDWQATSVCYIPAAWTVYSLLIVGVKPETLGRENFDWEAILEPSADPTTQKKGDWPGCLRTQKLTIFRARKNKLSKTSYEAKVTSKPSSLANRIIWLALKMVVVCPRFNSIGEFDSTRFSTMSLQIV